MANFTCKVHQIGKAPRRIELLGDKTRRPESAQHVIEFPGGAIEISRTSNGDYWAHIHVNRDEVVEDAEGRVSAKGKVVGSRMFLEDKGLSEIPDGSEIEQIAILICSDS